MSVYTMDHYATILEIDVFPTEPEKQNKEQERYVRDLVETHGFSVADISVDMGGNPILTDAFIATEPTLSRVENIEKKLEEWYPNHDVSYTTTYSDFYRETTIFDQIQLISIEYTDQGTVDREKMKTLHESK